MITVPTHKRHKSPFKHSKTIYVFTSGPVKSLHVQFHNRKNLVKGLKWPLQNWHQYRSGAGVTLRCSKIEWKVVFAGVGVEMLLGRYMHLYCFQAPPKNFGIFTLVQV
jgi:hypothetical protein